MNNIISKETVTRLLKDVKQIIKNPLTDNGIYYIHDEDDMLKGYALIIGPSDTPYYGGYYFFEITYPCDYPHSPPKVKFCTNSGNIRFNPNLYTCGKVCVSLLNTWRGDQWTSCQSISTVLLTLCTLLCKTPLLNEPGVNMNHIDIDNYNEIIEYSNINIAVCDILLKKNSIFLTFFDKFYEIIKEEFNKNYDNILNFVLNKYENNKTIKNVKMNSYYSMKITIDYEMLIKKLEETKIFINK
jgi:ubiquitin-conjugating enzyme E2 Z